MIRFIYFGKQKVLISFLFYCSFFTYGQSPEFVVPDSLETVAEDDIFKSYIKVFEDTLKSKVYLNSYLKKATIKNDNFKKVIALNYLSYYEKNGIKKIKLLDSAISITLKHTSDNEKFPDFPELSFSYKGNYFLSIGKYKEALDNYIIGLKFAEESADDQWIFIMKHNIAVIKLDIGRNKEALKLFKECYLYEKNRIDFYPYSYYESLLSLSEVYLKNKINDTANIHIEEGIEKTKDVHSDLYYRFLLLKGVYHLNNYNLKESQFYLREALKNIERGNPENNKFLIFTYSQLGKYFKLKNFKEKALKNYLVVDSIIDNTNIRFPEARQSYEYLIKYYETENDVNKQLKYITKLLVFDSIYNKNKGIIGEELYNKFDTPRLINEKAKLIRKLNQEKSYLNLILYFTVLLLVISFIILYLEHRKRKVFKSRYENLINVNLLDKKTPNLNTKEISQKDTDLKEEIVQDIILKLKEFETKRGYLNKDVTLSNLSKEINTNTRYLSKVINHTKNKNFSSYINELRIDYVIEELKKNRKLRNYTIKEVGKEIGFKNAESFSTAFRKKTGLKPSYFIKTLNSENI